MNAQRSALVRLDDTSLTLADPAQDIRGRDVLDRSRKKIGSVDGLLIDEREAHVRMIEIGSGGFLGIGETKKLIPIDAVTRVDDDHVHIDRSRDHVAGGPAFDPDLVDEQQFDTVYGYYGYDPYWAPGYEYPGLPYYHHA